MTGPWNILRHMNVWAAAAHKDGDGGGSDGGGGGGGSDNRSEADIQKDINNALKESGGAWTPELNDLVAERDVARGGGGGGGAPPSDTTFEFEGPMPDGTAGFTQDVSTIGVDPLTGYLTGDDDDDDFSIGYGAGQIDPALAAAAGIQSSQPAARTTSQDVAASFEEEAVAADRDRVVQDDFDYTPVTPLDTSGGIESLLAPPGTGATDVYDDDDSVFEGPMLDGTAGFTQDTSLQTVDPTTGFITEDQGAPSYVPPDLSAVFTAPTGALTPTQIEVQQAGIVQQQQAYNEMLERARAARSLPTTPVSPLLANELGSFLPPARDRSGITSIGYDIGQIDPGLARAAGIEDGQPAFGQTTGRSTIESLYGLPEMEDITPSIDNLADLTLATGRLDQTQQLLEARPDLVLAPPAQQTVVATGQVPVGTPRTAPQDVYMANEVQTLIESSPQARQVYDTMGLTPFVAGTYSIGLASGTQSEPTQIINYRDQQGNVYSQAEALDRLQTAGAQTTTLPGGYTAIAPLDVTTPTIPALDLGLTPVDVAIPVTTAPGGGGGGGGTRGGGAGRGDPRDFGFVAEEAAASRGSPAGLEGLLERSPTLGQPATTTVPQASDIVMPGVETSPTISREPPPEMVPPGGEEAPSVDVTIAPRDEVGGEPEAAEEVEVQVDTGEDTRIGVEEDTGTGLEEAGAPGGAEGDEGAGEGVEVDVGAGEDEGAGTGGEGGGEGTGEGTGTGAGEGEGTGTGTGGGEGAGEGTGVGDGTGAGEGDGEPSGEEDTEVVVDEEEEELPVEEEEEPAFECPPGFRRVQMANGGFTCVPEMVRPRVGPYTGTVDVSALEGRTVFRPGTRSR